MIEEEKMRSAKQATAYNELRLTYSQCRETATGNLKLLEKYKQKLLDGKETYKKVKSDFLRLYEDGQRTLKQYETFNAETEARGHEKVKCVIDFFRWQYDLYKFVDSDGCFVSFPKIETIMSYVPDDDEEDDENEDEADETMEQPPELCSKATIGRSGTDKRSGHSPCEGTGSE